MFPKLLIQSVTKKNVTENLLVCRRVHKSFFFVSDLFLLVFCATKLNDLKIAQLN